MLVQNDMNPLKEISVTDCFAFFQEQVGTLPGTRPPATNNETKSRNMINMSSGRLTKKKGRQRNILPVEWRSYLS